MKDFKNSGKAMSIGNMQDMYEKYNIEEYTEGKGITKAHAHDVRSSQLLRVIRHYEDILNSATCKNGS